MALWHLGAQPEHCWALGHCPPLSVVISASVSCPRRTLGDLPRGLELGLLARSRTVPCVFAALTPGHLHTELVAGARGKEEPEKFLDTLYVDRTKVQPWKSLHTPVQP